MSWNLIIYKPGNNPQENESLGNRDAVAGAFESVFTGLVWESSSEALLPVDGGFRLELSVEDGLVQDVYTHGGYNHVEQFAALCKREGWRMADAQEGEDVDLNNPKGWIDDRSG